MLRKGMFISDRYEVIDKIGSGGMSDVYKSKDHKLNRFVALKVLKSEFSGDKNFVTKFKVEAQSAAGLSHPNIVNVFDVGEDKGIHYIVMELIEGITLKKYIDRKGKLPVKEAVSILIQVSQGIEAAHNNHIIHRDIKPQNIIISKEGKVKVTDFGIARAASANTISSNAMGSVHYISPEQAKGGFIDEKSDIYSLGITLYEMLTGRVPFEGDSTVSIALQHVQNDLPSPKLYAPDLPVSVVKIVEKCTQKKSDRRYLKVSSLIADLKHALVAPDEDFVKIVNGVDENAVTKMISDQEVSIIRRETGFEKPVLDKDNEILEEDDEEDDIVDDLEYEEEDNPKFDKIMAIGGIVMAIFMLVIVVFLIITFAGKGCSGSKSGASTTQSETLDAKHTKVPKVEGLKEEEAIQKLKEATLGYKIEEQYDNKTEEGYVISASRDANEVVEKNTTITLVVSRGGQAFDVPDVVGKTKDQAKEILKDKGLKIKFEYEASETVPIDQVMKTDPAAPKQVRYGDEITLYISSGTNATIVTMPKIINLSQDAAKATLEGQGLKLGNVTEEFSDEVEKGKVCKQSVEPNGKVTAGSSIDIAISKGPEQKPEVPDLEGKSEEKAKEELSAIGLEIGNVSTRHSDSVTKGCIISQGISAGQRVSKGTKIDITVSKGPEETTTEKPTEIETTTKQEETTAKSVRKTVRVKLQKDQLANENISGHEDEQVWIVVSVEDTVVSSASVGAYSDLPNILEETFKFVDEDGKYEGVTQATIQIYLGQGGNRVYLYRGSETIQ